MADRRPVHIAREGAPRDAAGGGIEWLRHAVHAMTPKEIRSRRLALALSVAELARELRATRDLQEDGSVTVGLMPPVRGKVFPVDDGIGSF